MLLYAAVCCPAGGAGLVHRGGAAHGCPTLSSPYPATEAGWCIGLCALAQKTTLAVTATVSDSTGMLGGGRVGASTKLRPRRRSAPWGLIVGKHSGVPALGGEALPEKPRGGTPPSKLLCPPTYAPPSPRIVGKYGGVPALGGVALPNKPRGSLLKATASTGVRWPVMLGPHQAQHAERSMPAAHRHYGPLMQTVQQHAPTPCSRKACAASHIMPCPQPPVQLQGRSSTAWPRARTRATLRRCSSSRRPPRSTGGRARGRCVPRAGHTPQGPLVHVYVKFMLSLWRQARGAERVAGACHTPRIGQIRDCLLYLCGIHAVYTVSSRGNTAAWACRIRIWPTLHTPQGPFS